MEQNDSKIYAKIDGPIVMIGFGSIGKGFLPLLLRHFSFDIKNLVVIASNEENKEILDEHGIKFIKSELNENNYIDVLLPLISKGNAGGFCINVSVGISSLDLIKLCRKHNTFYIDTVIEPWDGFYFNNNFKPYERSNYTLRESLLAERRKNPSGITAVSCCGANPGMVSWFVKQALIDIANDIGVSFETPTNRTEWAKLMQAVGIKGIHIAERDTQRSKEHRKLNVFVNTWSVDGFISEGNQPAELGYGTHEKWLPKTGKEHETGCKASIYMLQPGANTRVRSWCPTPGPQLARLVTHNEAISIADYFTVGDCNNPEYRPTCHYAYHPCDDAILSLDEMFANAGKPQEKWHILSENEIVSGIDELGVLLYGHKKNAYWYGSQLSIEETRELAPHQNATGLQVTSAILAGMVWMIENPNSGIVEADDMDFIRCLDIQKPYLGSVKSYYTDWTPLKERCKLFPEDVDFEDPWQFKNILVHD